MPWLRSDVVAVGLRGRDIAALLVTAAVASLQSGSSGGTGPGPAGGPPAVDATALRYTVLCDYITGHCLLIDGGAFPGVP
jgi:hypothetical protein